MRPLDLHVSALSDEEYAFYTAALADLATPHDFGADYGTLSIAVREARAWLRGRYNEVSAADIDSVFNLLRPDSHQLETLTSGQFFVVLRLVVHIDGGKPLDSSLAFIQADLHARDAALSPARENAYSMHTTRIGKNPGRLSNDTSLRPPTAPSSPCPALLDPTAIASPVPFSLSPSLTRPSTLSTRRNDPARGKPTPPLPPRKSNAFPPPRNPPVASLKLPSIVSDSVSRLMQESLEASKAGQSKKKAEELLEKDRVLQVLKTSLPGSERTKTITPPNSTSGSGDSPLKNRSALSHLPPPGRRKTAALHYQGPDFFQSYEEVAGAHVPSFTSIPVQPSAGAPSVGVPHPSPLRPTAATSISPPSHPDRRLPDVKSDSDTSTSASFRILRSHSIHHPSPVPRVPPRRRRPESVGLMSPVTVEPAPSSISPDERRPPLLSLAHQNVMAARPPPSAMGDQAQSSIFQLQKMFEKLQTRAQPSLDKARYKAEAGLIRRGFAKAMEEGHQSLMDDTDSGFDLDDEGSSRWSGASNNDGKPRALEMSGVKLDSGYD